MPIDEHDSQSGERFDRRPTGDSRAQAVVTTNDQKEVNMTFKEAIADFAVSKSRSVRPLALWLLLSTLCACPILGWTQTNWATGQVRTVPLEAIVAGHEANGAALYACRGGSNEGYRQQVGKFRLGFAGCNFGLGGREIVVSDFQILVTSWQNANSGYVPPNAVQGGDEAPPPGQFGGPPVYYC